MLRIETFAENLKDQIQSENVNNIIQAWYDRKSNNYQQNQNSLN